MKKLILVSFLSVLSMISIGAEEIQIKDKKQVIEGINHQGIVTEVRLDQKFVLPIWKNYLKQFGKVSYSKGNYTLSEAIIPGMNAGNPMQIYTSVKGFGNQTTVFWAINKGHEYVSSGSDEYADFKLLLYQFAVDAYRNDVLLEIKDAEKALLRTVREQERSIAAGDQLGLHLLQNTNKHESLEENLIENEQSKVRLDSLQQVNKLQQIEKELRVQQMHEALELVRDKLKDIR